MALVYVAAILGCAILISGQTQRFRCDQYKTVSNFTVNQYTGLWFEIERIPIVYETVGECATAHYTLLDNGVMAVNNTMCLYNNMVSIAGNATEQEAGSAKNGKFSVNFPTMGSAKSPYWILATNYTEFALVVSCTEKQNGQSMYAWILSRRPTLTLEQNKQINEILESNNLLRDYFKITKQENCCYYDTMPHIMHSSSVASVVSSLGLLITTIIVQLF